MKRMKQLLGSVITAMGAASAWAGPVQVTVTDKDGKPAANVAVVVTAQGAMPPRSTTPVVVAQDGLQFVPFLTVVRTGTTLRFVNRDPYDHHVRSLPGGPLGSIKPAKDFEMRIDAAEGRIERSADIVADKPGVIALGCHIHGSMRGHVLVVDSPWFGKTNANGQAVVEGLPDSGVADVKLWHPDQLVDQSTLTVTLGTAPAQAVGQLNFAPKRRRGS
jgi:plastocyanin